MMRKQPFGRCERLAVGRRSARSWHDVITLLNDHRVEILAARTLKDLALAMIVRRHTRGAYSRIFIAAPPLTHDGEGREPEFAKR